MQAWRGKSSVRRRPGTRVAMGAIGPRYSLGAGGVGPGFLVCARPRGGSVCFLDGGGGFWVGPWVPLANSRVAFNPGAQMMNYLAAPSHNPAFGAAPAGGGKNPPPPPGALK